MNPLPTAVSAYAGRLHRAIGSHHHVASPLGAWLVLALAGRAATDARARERLADVLGGPVDDASELALTLLANPHPAVRLAAAAWHSVESPELSVWLDQIASAVAVDAMPSPAKADAWAREKTNGLIERFQLEIDSETLLVLASAVACAISWQTPFAAADASELLLSRADGFDAVRSVLRTPAYPAQEALVDSDIGILATHSVPSTELDLLVVSVIADPAVPAPDVLEHAHTIALALADAERPPLPRARSLFDLPLGAGHSWTLSEQPTMRPSDQERFVSFLPAWSAESMHELTGYDGFPEVGLALAGLLPPNARGHLFEARQSALARYTRTGFEAAAVTATAIRASAMRSHESRIRTAQVEYMHPYAVVAVALADPPSPWTGLPLFSAWISHADEA